MAEATLLVRRHHISIRFSKVVIGNTKNTYKQKHFEKKKIEILRIKLKQIIQKCFSGLIVSYE